MAIWENNAARDLIGWGLTEAEGRALAGEIKFRTFRHLVIGPASENRIRDGLGLSVAEVATVNQLDDWGLARDTATALFAEFKFHAISNVVLL